MMINVTLFLSTVLVLHREESHLVLHVTQSIFAFKYNDKDKEIILQLAVTFIIKNELWSKSNEISV